MKNISIHGFEKPPLPKQPEPIVFGEKKSEVPFEILLTRVNFTRALEATPVEATSELDSVPVVAPLRLRTVQPLPPEPKSKGPPRKGKNPYHDSVAYMQAKMFR